MNRQLTVHYDNRAPFAHPIVLVRSADGEPALIHPSGQDEFGAVFTFEVADNPVLLKFGDETEAENVESDSLWRQVEFADTKSLEVWCRSWHPFVLTSQPQTVAEVDAGEIACNTHFTWGQYISDTGGRFALGANPLRDGGVLFGFFHPHAARVYVTGTFNDWQYPGVEDADASKFVEMTLHSGYFDVPNVWLARVDHAQAGDEYKFYVVYDALAGEGQLENRLVTDPYARLFGPDYEQNNAVVVDSTQFYWDDTNYQTPAVHELIIYELHVHGFTHGHADIAPEHQGTYQGVIDRIQAGYFDKLGVTALYLMPLAEAPTPQGETALGYNTAVFTAVERDFGSPDDLRRLVNEAHKAGLAVIVDQVFNHTANAYNPLWKLILDHPDEWGRGDEGGLYFSGASPWGNRTATERVETQNMLIDACKLMLVEYDVDGFRFDYTHSSIMHHEFLNRLADEVRVVNPNTILIAENMPNESDLNRQGFDGFAQWHDRFHDGIKALLREGRFEALDDRPEVLGEMFYFSKGSFAAHTNNVVNYSESHDEHSIPFELTTTGDPNLETPAAKERKARLGLGASLLALGQPMLYMGQEFCIERERNHVYYARPDQPEQDPFFRWASGMIHLRRRYPGLKLHGYDPIADGQFEWIVGPWLDDQHGAGKRVIGWRSTPTDDEFDRLVVLLNFENYPVEIDLELGFPGIWVRLATIDLVTDVPPYGNASADDDVALDVTEPQIPGFVLPDSSLFIYKWQALA